MLYCAGGGRDALRDRRPGVRSARESAGPAAHADRPGAARGPQLRGEVSGEAVVTAVSVSVLDMVGIFNVATLAAYRRRGYGAAVTARAFQDALG
jgi:hypothetical protein